MAQHGIANDAFFYVADSAMVTEENIAQADLFIARLPATYNECARAVQDVVDADQWVEIGEIASATATKNRPNASYRIHETTVTLYDKTYRAIVVHSSAHDKRRHKRLECELAASLKAASTLSAILMKRRFFCRADAEQAAKDLLTKTTRLISLLVWRLVEHAMRTELKEDDTTLAGWDNKPTKRPISYMVSGSFAALLSFALGRSVS